MQHSVSTARNSPRNAHTPKTAFFGSLGGGPSMWNCSTSSTSCGCADTSACRDDAAIAGETLQKKDEAVSGRTSNQLRAQFSEKYIVGTPTPTQGWCAPLRFRIRLALHPIAGAVP